MPKHLIPVTTVDHAIDPGDLSHHNLTMTIVASRRTEQEASEEPALKLVSRTGIAKCGTGSEA